MCELVLEVCIYPKLHMDCNFKLWTLTKNFGKSVQLFAIVVGNFRMSMFFL